MRSFFAELAGAGYVAPREVLSGHGSSRDIGQALRAYGVSSGAVVVVADAFVSRAGLLDASVAGLRARGFDPVVFDEIDGEPNDIVTMRAAEQGRACGAVAVVGVGGGSALDVAKVVALLLTNSGTIADWLGVIEPVAQVAPLVLIPTTTGTGSEATRISMITVEGTKRIVSCAQLVPLIAVLDPDLVAGLPAGVIASTGMDALAHAVESMLSTSRSSFTVALATRAAEILRDQLERAALDDDTDAKGRVLYAAHLSGLALNAGVVLGHSLAYVIARHAPMPHGTSCALALPYCIGYNRGVEPELAQHVAQVLTDGRSTELRAGADSVDKLAERLGLPRSLSVTGIDVGELDEMACQTVREYPRPNNPAPIEEKAVRSLLTYMHRGDVAAACSDHQEG